MNQEPTSRPVPPRLYKYQPFTERTLTNLNRREVWFARPETFNDPFDCALALRIEDPSDEELLRQLELYQEALGDRALDPVAAGYLDAEGRPTADFKDRVVGAAAEQLQGKAQENRTARGVTCFSEEPDDLLLWAHYGAGHRGFCLEFDTNTELFRKALPVRYDDGLPALNIVQALEGTAPVDWMADVLTKARCWSYEREWRVIHVEPDRPFTYDWRALTAVYFGAAMDDAHKEMIALILAGAPTRLFTFRHRTDTFALEAASIEYTPYDYQANA